MNRLERLHALTEHLRRVAPRPVSAASLADRFGVSRRTIERDLAALRNAGVEPGQVGMVEAHGTGTPLGDPIEVDALRAVYATSEDRQPVWLGSVKTNFGHTETAAGPASDAQRLVLRVRVSEHTRAVGVLCSQNGAPSGRASRNSANPLR